MCGISSLLIIVSALSCRPVSPWLCILWRQKSHDVSSNDLNLQTINQHFPDHNFQVAAAMFFTQLIHTAQMAIGCYGAYVSYIAIRNLQQYEEKSEKAAKYSGEAEHQLHKTRTTQTSGAICVCCQYSLLFPWGTQMLTEGQILTSLVASVTLTVTPNSLPKLVRFGINPAMLVLVLFVRAHVSNFWKGKAKVPFVDGYVSFSELLLESAMIRGLLEHVS